MAEHTPGPWRLVTQRDCTDEYRTYLEPFGLDVTDIHPVNVSLLAAAPDLLAACKAALRALEAMTTASPIRAAQLDSAICEVEAAIRLAETGGADG